MSPSQRVLLGAQLAREDLESGFTRCVISGTPASTAMSRCGMQSIRAACQAPECWPPGVNSRPRAGTSKVSIRPSANQSCEQEFFEVGSPEQARQAVRENIFYNVDVVKVCDRRRPHTSGNDGDRR